MKKIYFILLALFLLSACDREDLNDLYRQAEENEVLVKKLEEEVFDMNEQITNLYNLTQALMQRHHLTGKEKTKDGYLLTFNDTVRIEILQGHTPVLEIDPNNGNWLIDGKDTGVKAKGLDGNSPKHPQIRINPGTFCWEISTDGNTWITTGIRAKGETGDDGQAPSISINDSGNWTIGGVETTPPVSADGKNGTDGIPPRIGIDKTQSPPVWTISTDGGNTWNSTGIPAQGEDGDPGADGTDSGQYIQSVSVIGDTIIFTFNTNIPGIVPATRIQKVGLHKPAFAISVTSANWQNIGGKQWLLFDVSHTEIVSYTVTGTAAVSVDAIDLPNGIRVKVDEENRKITITSVSESGLPISAYGNFTLLALDESGRTASTKINISFVHTFTEEDFTESYIYEIITPGNNRIAYLYSQDIGSSSKKRKYYYGQIFSYDPPAGITKAYSCTLRPLIGIDADGNRYKTTLFFEGRQLWFSENLKTTHYNDGTGIPNLTDNTAWANDTKGAFRDYDKNPGNRDKYGILYNGHAVATGKLAPIGWRIPTEDDWLAMEKARGMADAGNTGWRNGGSLGNLLKSPAPDWDGRGKYLFMAHPSGICSDDGTQFLEAGISGYWWSSTRTNTGLYYRQMQGGQSGIYRNADKNMNTGMSVRCVRDL